MALSPSRLFTASTKSVPAEPFSCADAGTETAASKAPARIAKLNSFTTLCPDYPLDRLRLAEQGCLCHERPQSILGKAAERARPRGVGGVVRWLRPLLRPQ